MARKQFGENGKIKLSDIQQYSSYITENTLYLYFNNQSVKALWGDQSLATATLIQDT